MKLTRSAVLTAVCAGAAFAQLPAQKMLTVDVAQTILHEAMMKCRADGFRVTVRVVDSANILKAFVRDDGAPMGTLDMARMKTNTVMSFGRASGPPPNLAPGSAVPPPLFPDTINFKGAVPIRAGEQLIGAVAVSGASTDDQDAACANAGLAKVTDHLK